MEEIILPFSPESGSETLKTATTVSGEFSGIELMSLDMVSSGVVVVPIHHLYSYSAFPRKPPTIFVAPPTWLLSNFLVRPASP